MSPKESVTNNRVIKLIKKGVGALGVRGLARAVGVSPAIVTRYMQGKVGEPSQATLVRLADYFGVSVAWLRGDIGKPLPRLTDKLQEQIKTKNLLEISKAVGISTTILNEFVKGEDRPDDLMLNRLAEYFKVSVAWLKGETPDNMIFKDHPWPSNYDMWAIMLSSQEVFLTAALDNQKEMIKDKIAVKAVLDIANKVVNMSDDLSAQFNQEHLSDVRNMAYSVIKKYCPK